jgi:hypothetical protein
MRLLSSNFALPLAALLFVFLLVPQAALAQSENCPPEPVPDTPIATGDTFIGSNCTLYTVGDVDSFVFSANKGDVWQLTLGYNSTADASICLALYAPTGGAAIYYGCTELGWTGAVVTDQTLTATGTYTLAITETSTATQSYAVSTERLNPLPPNAQRVSLGKVYAGDIAWPTGSNAFTFAGVAKDEFEVSATVPGGATQSLCMNLYYPDATSAGSGCTEVGWTSTVQIDVTPPKSETVMAFVTVGGDDATVPSYSFEVSCLVGANGCLAPPPPAPACTLKDVVTYDPTSSTLTMNFTVGNKAAATWNVWLTYQNTMTLLSGFPISQPITNPPVTVIETTPLSPSGTVWVLSTLTTPKNGIICSSWEEIKTGTP